MSGKEDRKWRRERNAKIRKRRKEGDTVKMLAHDYGLSASSIRRILRAGGRK